MKKNLILVFLLITCLLSFTKGQTSINISPAYNFLVINGFVLKGIGVETGIRFNSSKIFRYGFDIGYNQGAITESINLISYPDTTTIILNEFKNSYIPLQLIGELKTNKRKTQLLVGLGAGCAFLDKQARLDYLFSGYLGLFYQINNKVGLFSNAKLSVGFRDFAETPSSGGFTATLGINYQFNNK